MAAASCSRRRSHSSGVAQIRFLKCEGYHVTQRPNGRPLLMRSELERVAGAARLGLAPVQNAGRQPDRASLLQVIHGGKRGPQAQRR